MSKRESVLGSNVCMQFSAISVLGWQPKIESSAKLRGESDSLALRDDAEAPISVVVKESRRDVLDVGVFGKGGGEGPEGEGSREPLAGGSFETGRRGIDSESLAVPGTSILARMASEIKSAESDVNALMFPMAILMLSRTALQSKESLKAVNRDVRKCFDGTRSKINSWSRSVLTSLTQTARDSCCAGNPALLRPMVVTMKRDCRLKRHSWAVSRQKRKWLPTKEAVSFRTVGLSSVAKSSLSVCILKISEKKA